MIRDIDLTLTPQEAFEEKTIIKRASSKCGMANDKVTGVLKDLTITPLKRHTLALSYYFGTLVTTLMVNAIALVACFI